MQIRGALMVPSCLVYFTYLTRVAQTPNQVSLGIQREIFVSETLSRK